MRPEKLTLQNFGPFTGRETIDFKALDDIFLITGKTGSGKTTIFDALCFALYGAVPGSRRTHTSRLKSDYAAEGDECLVSLEFSAGQKRWRIDREPKQEKARKRKSADSALSAAPGTAALYELKQEGAVLISAKKSEADQAIRELIGLEAEEFFKIVLLPQGEFAEFLRQNSTERRAVLGKLFPVDRAAALRELAQEKARAAASSCREAERALAEIGKRVSFESYDAAHGEAERGLEAARSRFALTAEAAAAARELAALKQREAGIAARLEAAQGERERLESSAGQIQDKEERLARSRKAEPLRRFLMAAETGKAEAEQAGREYAAAAAALAQARTALDKAEADLPALNALEAESRALLEKRPVLTAMLEEEARLRRDTEEAGRQRSRLEALAARKAALAGELHQKETDAAVLQERSAQAGELDARWEAERAVMDRLAEMKKTAAEAESLCAEGEELERKLREAGERREELSRRVPVLEEELQQLKKDKEAAARADMAAHLSMDLRPGEPCPVCGSAEHPLPAAAKARVFGLDERIGALEHALRDAGGALAARTAEGESRREEYARLEKRRAALEARAASARRGVPALDDPALARFFGQSGLPRLAEAAPLLAARLEALNGVTKQRSDAQRALSKLAELYREQQAVQAGIAELDTEYAALEEKHRALNQGIAQIKARRAEQFGLASADQEPGGAVAALADLERRLKENEARAGRYRAAREAGGKQFAGASAREAGALQERDARQARYGEASAALAQALAASPFATEQALAGALVPEEAETRWAREISHWREERSRLESLETELRRGLGEIQGEAEQRGAAGLTAEDIEARLDLLAGEREAAEAARDRAAGALAALERDGAALREARERFLQLAEQSGRLTALADDLGGKNPKKTSFDAWLLGRYLAEAALFATRRLERMSEGRYSLLLDSGGEAGRGRAGLDLAVFDAYTGKTRPCATLSGGESFMASISLALGLADSIQSRSGAVRLDAVFIDEGFGSLDEGSLDKALIILDELRDHRMVGLISHVGELRSRIPSHIELVKTGAGSKIQK